MKPYDKISSNHIPTPKEGYDLLGWYKNEERTDPFLFQEPIKEHLSLYPHLIK